MQWYSCSYCSCLDATAVRLLETKLTRFCLESLKPETLKCSIQDGVRRFTYIRGLVVSWSSHAAFQSLDIEIVGYASSLSLWLNLETEIESIDIMQPVKVALKRPFLKI